MDTKARVSKAMQWKQCLENMECYLRLCYKYDVEEHLIESYMNDGVVYSTWYRYLKKVYMDACTQWLLWFMYFNLINVRRYMKTTYGHDMSQHVLSTNTLLYRYINRKYITCQYFINTVSSWRRDFSIMFCDEYDLPICNNIIIIYYILLAVMNFLPFLIHTMEIILLTILVEIFSSYQLIIPLFVLYKTMIVYLISTGHTTSNCNGSYPCYINNSNSSYSDSNYNEGKEYGDQTYDDRNGDDRRSDNRVMLLSLQARIRELHSIMHMKSMMSFEGIPS